VFPGFDHSSFATVVETMPRWAWMWSLAMAIYVACKWLTWHAAKETGADGKLQAGYLLLWPGMDSEAFLTGRRSVVSPALAEWLLAGAKLCFGLLLLYGLLPRLAPEQELLVGWTGMIGLIFVLHFGLFHLLSCGWRSVGVDAQPLMDWPIAATSLGEFWGRRWNRAFRDLAFRFLFRPLTRKVGAAWGLMTGFLVSGLVHDAVISIPAGGGYGGPTLFFLVQGAGMLAQRSAPGRRLGMDRGSGGWLSTAACLLLPVTVLFHRPFIGNVIVPFLHAIGAAG